MADSARSDRSEKPTGRRLEKAREEGRVPRSTEIPAITVLAGFLIFCELAGNSWLTSLRTFLGDSLAHLNGPDATIEGTMALFRSTTLTAFALLGPPLGAMCAAGLAGNLVQGPPTFTLKPLTWSLARLNPAANLGKVVSARSGVAALKALLKVSIFGWVALDAARDALVRPTGGGPGAEGTMQALAALAGTVLLRVIFLGSALAAVDYLFQRYQFRKSLMMTKREVRDELREQDGDPLIKSRIRSKQLAFARMRMMAEVPRATVVLTNPTHVAVALRYVPGETEVPKVIAKGAELLAERIRAVAREHGVPIVSNPPLARSLYRTVRVGSEIPSALYRAVAEVLAIVLSRKAGASVAGAKPVEIPS